MTQSVRKRTDCRLCGSGQLELAVPIRDCPIGDAFVSKDQLNIKQELYPMDLYLCMECSHLQLPYIVDPEILFSNYTYKTSSSVGLVKHFEQYAKDVLEKTQIKSPGLVVEIGSNDGSLLGFYKQSGLKVLGIDPAKAIAADATSRGIETWPTFFNEKVADQVIEKCGQASLVCANNVYAHADDMTGITRGISKLLKKDGVFVFEVSYLLDLVQKKVFDTIYLEHLCHHSVKPLESFFRKHGMMLFDIQRNPSKGGSMRCFAQRVDGPRTAAPIVQELIELEHRLGYHKLGVYSEFAQSLEKLHDDLHLFLKTAKAQGKKIAGYGASNPNTTVVYHLELGEFLTKLYDDNPVKQGTFSPGFHIPVVPSDQIYEDKPDYIVVLAWAYADNIKNKHMKYLTELGGRLIVPIPDLRIIG